MTLRDDVAGIPATERAVVGLCHALNDQLAAVNAYAFLLKRRGVLDDADTPLHFHLDRLAESVRLVRSLCRDPEPEIGPVALTLLAEAATQIMDGFPDGTVVFNAEEAEGAVIRCDWARAIRAILLAGAWVSRDVLDDVTVDLGVDDAGTLELLARGDLSEPRDAEGHPDVGCEPVSIESTGARSVSISFG